MLGLAHTGIQASIVEAPLVATVFQVELNRDSSSPSQEAVIPLSAASPEPIEMLPSTAFLSTPRQETIYQIATAGRVLTEDEIRLLARAAGWPEHTLGDLLEVAWCESRYNPVAMNGPAIHGLMQVHTLWFTYSGLDRAEWSNALVNLQVAFAAYNYDLMQGYTPWTQWQCRPGGVYIPTEEFVPHLPDVEVEPGGVGDPENPGDEAAAIDGSQSGGSQPGDSHRPGATESATPGASEPVTGSPTPEPTPAPWDYKPSWPPKVEREGEQGAADPVEAATPSPTAPGVVVVHPPDAPNDPAVDP